MEKLRLRTNGSIWVRDCGTIPAERAPDRFRRTVREKVKGQRLTAANARSALLCYFYKAIGLAVIAYKEGTLLLRWSLEERTLPAVTRSGSPILRRNFMPEE